MAVFSGVGSSHSFRGANSLSVFLDLGEAHIVLQSQLVNLANSSSGKSISMNQVCELNTSWALQLVCPQHHTLNDLIGSKPLGLELLPIFMSDENLFTFCELMGSYKFVMETFTVHCPFIDRPIRLSSGHLDLL